MTCGCGGIVVESTTGDVRVWECIRCGAQVGQGQAWAGGAGDAADEHLAMERGDYDAWTHVVLAFLLQMAVGTVLVAVAVEWLGHALSSTLAAQWAFGIGAVAGPALAIGVFWDRWRCTEAFASNYCSGCANFSILYVPFFALAYANSRGIPRLYRALTGQRQRDGASFPIRP